MRGRLLAVAVVAFLTSGAAHAQTCTSYSTIPNFRTVSYVKGVSWTFAWDPIPGTPAGYQYDVVVNSGPDVCAATRTVTTISATTYTLQLSPQDTFFQPFVQAHGDPCKSAGGSTWADTFTNIPQKPPAPRVTVGNSMVTGTIVSYGDSRVSVVWLERAGTDGKFRIIGGYWNCSRYWPYSVVDYGSDFGGTSTAPKLPEGVYQYRLRADNMTGLIPSDPVTVTVGPPQTFGITSFTASPTSIRPGQPVTLSWVTSGANSVLIDNKVGTLAASGTATVKPTTTTTYTLTATLGSQTLTSAVTINVLTQPIVNVTMMPSAMLQPAGSGGALTSYALTNSGGTAATVTLTQTGSFFTQSPASFTLQPGATQIVTIAGTSQSAGSYEGTSNVAGNGVPANLQIPVKLLSAAPPSGTVTADASANRIDVASAAANNPTGSVSFTNHGTATLTGILNADVPWMVPQSGVITIAPNQTVTLTFAIDRTKRPDASALIGSAEGNLSLSFLGGKGASFAAKQPHDTTTPTPSVSLVKIVDTVQSTVTTAGVPTIASGEVALFVAGVGHVIGSRGVLFVSDVTLLNPQGTKSVDDVKFYYTPMSGNPSTAKATSMPSVPGQMSIAVADVVKNLFNGVDEVGTLHIRSKDADKLAVAATVLTTNNPSGTFGNIIPVFRSDRATASGSATVLTGLRKDATTHTNLYVQEVGGFPATVQIDFLANDGSVISSRPPDAIDTFKLLQLVNIVPANAVTAVITNTSTAGGKIAAYATPVDEVSSDTWAIVDWSRQLGYAPTEATVIPIAGSLHGANSTFYRTDVAIMNRGTSSASGTLRYIARNGETRDRQISLGAKQSDIIADVVGSRFNVVGDSAGFLIFTPVTGSFAITSRTFTTVGGTPDTFGTGVPALAASASLKAGGSRPIAGLADSTRMAVVAGRAGTFRTNFALMETTGNSVTVRVTFRFTFPAGQKAQGIGAAARDYMLNGNQFLMLNSIAGEILGVARLQYGDLSNVEADFQILDGSGAVQLFTSSVENATGDSILRTQ